MRDRQAAELQALMRGMRTGQREPVQPDATPPPPLRERTAVAADLEAWRARRVAWEAEETAKAAADAAERAPEQAADPASDPACKKVGHFCPRT